MPAGRFDRGGWKRVKNVHASIAPAGGFAIPASPSFDATHDCVIITRPTADDMPNVLIISEDIPVNGYGIAYESGTLPLLYNGAAPAVDDRVGSQTDSWHGVVSADGTHLVRAISGGIAFGFFTPPGEAGVTTIDPFTDYCYIESAQPNNAFGHNVQAACSWGKLSGTTQIGVVKFGSRISTSLHTHICLGFLNSLQVSVYQTGFDAYTRGIFEIYKITDDFDPSALTWNIYAGLAKTKVGELARENFVAAQGGTNVRAVSQSDGGGGSGKEDEDGDLLVRNINDNSYYRFNLSNAYGLSIDPSGSYGNGINGFASMNIRLRTVDGNPYNPITCGWAGKLEGFY